MPSITATTTERCPCCSLANTLQCRTRGGTASLIGYAEYTSASTPPKKYLVRTLSGSFARVSYLDAACTTVNCTTTSDYSGACSYNATTGALTSGGSYTNSGCISGSGSVCDLGSPNTALGDYVVLTQTTRLLTNTMQCLPFMSTSVKVISTPTSTETLSSEDTESNAITRLLASASWGSWINTGGTGCTGSPPSCCLAKYESRTSGFSFAYAESEARVTATGLTPSTGYTAKIELYRRTYGSGSYTHYQTATVTGTSDGSGNLTTSAVTVTNTKGYETYAASSSLFVT